MLLVKFCGAGLVVVYYSNVVFAIDLRYVALEQSLCKAKAAYVEVLTVVRKCLVVSCAVLIGVDYVGCLGYCRVNALAHMLNFSGAFACLFSNALEKERLKRSLAC